MKFIVPIGYLRAAFIAQAKNDVRYYLNGIHFKGNKIESTNGHTAYQAILNEGLNNLANELSGDITIGCEIPSDLIIKIDGKIPKSTRSKMISSAIIEVEDNNMVLIRYLDFLSIQVGVGQGEVIDGRYPDIDSAFDKWFDQQETKNETISFNADYLGLVDKISKTISQPFNSVKMETKNKDAGVKFNFHRPEFGENSEYLIVLPLRD